MAKGTGGILVDHLSGRIGNLVFLRQRDGSTSVRGYTAPTDPKTEAQLQWRANVKTAGMAFNRLTPTEYEQWRLYALTRTTLDPRTGAAKTPQVYNLYTTLGAKLLQAVPNATLPTLPPAQDFTGDGIRVTASADAGTVTYTASHANSAHIITELLFQPLSSPHRKPVVRSYRPQRFFTFTSAQLTQTVDAEAGWYACAIRFVQTETGQASALVEIGKVQVG